MMTTQIRLAARVSLAFLWFFTAITSAFFGREIGLAVLANADITGGLASLLLYSGSAVDLLIALWLITTWQLKKCYLAQIMVIVVYTLLLSFIDPSFWLHPFGPLTKNLPIIVLLYMLYRSE
ncbi:MAG: NAD-dependent epimerase/dehydratase [Osedax symbiont Rs1]|nr:MAG: NAD-dependent epimerase/dehydratase [Osedax symbiont Rs1]